MNRRIVVGLDGSAESVAAAHWAAREALLRGAPLHLVHAEIWSPPHGVPAAGSEERRQAARTLLREASDKLLDQHPRLNISAESFDGQPAASLVHATADAGMLVLGSRGLGTLRGFVLGSVGMAVIHAVERPVVLVRATEDALPHAQGQHLNRGVVVGVDTGRPCDALLSFAFDEASRRGCTLHALHSWMLPPLAGSGRRTTLKSTPGSPRSSAPDWTTCCGPGRTCTRLSNSTRKRRSAPPPSNSWRQVPKQV